MTHFTVQLIVPDDDSNTDDRALLSDKLDSISYAQDECNGACRITAPFEEVAQPLRIGHQVWQRPVQAESIESILFAFNQISWNQPELVSMVVIDYTNVTVHQAPLPCNTSTFKEYHTASHGLSQHVLELHERHVLAGFTRQEAKLKTLGVLAPANAPIDEEPMVELATLRAAMCADGWQDLDDSTIALFIAYSLQPTKASDEDDAGIESYRRKYQHKMRTNISDPLVAHYYYDLAEFVREHSAAYRGYRTAADAWILLRYLQESQLTATLIPNK